jgi:uncharacterized protein (TIGR02246 family)
MVANDRKTDEAAIRKLLDRQRMAWDAGDSEAYANVFTHDGDCVSFLGSHYQGREAIAKSYEVPHASWLLKKLLNGAHLDFEIIRLRFLTNDVALIHARGGVIRSARSNRRNNRVNTSVAVRTDDGWLLAASQNTTHRRRAEKLMGKLM